MSSFAIDVIVRGFVLMSSAWLVALVLRRRSASLRAGVWTVAFAALLALPAIARVTPAWKIAVLPTAIETPSVVPATLEVRGSGALEDQRALRTIPEPAASEPERPVFQGRVKNAYVAPTGLEVGGNGALQDQRALRTLSSTSGAAQTQRAVPTFSAAAIALAIWESVAMLLVARIVVRRFSAARLIRTSATSADGDAQWRADVEIAREELGIARRIRIRFTDAVAVPAVIGVFRPTLLLPLDAGEWSSDARRVVILHELAHVARWDAFDQLATEAGCALYWIVPPVWIAARSAAVLREQATDDAVIRAGVRPSAYAAELIDLAQNIAGVAPGAASLAMAGSRIQDRVAAILDPSVRRSRVTFRGALTLVFAAGLAVTTLAAVSPEREQVVPPVPPAPPALPAPPAPPAPVAELPLFPPPASELAQFPPIPPMPPQAPMTPMTPMAPMAPLPTFPMSAPTSLPAPMAPLAPKTPMTPPAPMAPIAPISKMTPPSAMAMAPLPPLPPGVPGLAPQATRGSSRTSSTSDKPERSTLCPDGRDNFSNMSNNDGSRQTWSIKVSGKGCTVELKAEGKVEFNDDFTDVASITPSGYFRLTVNRDGNRQELDIDGRGTSLTRTYRVNGSARAYDAAAKSWFGDFLIELDRETAVGVDTRLPKLLKQGGVDAVLKETALMTSDYARSRYYKKLGASVKLSSGEAVRILNQASSAGTQDYYAADLLKSIGAQVGDSSTERTALLALLDNMRSDYYIVEGVDAVFTTRAVRSADVDFLMRIVPRVQSDYYKQAMVKRIVDSGRVDSAQRGALAQVLTTMKEDYYMAALLGDLARDGGMTAAGRQALIGAVSRIKSAYYATEAVRSIVRDAGLDESELVRLVGVVDPMREEHYKSEALRSIVQHRNAGSKARQAVIDASAGMSKHYGDEVRRAAGERVR